MLFRCRLFSYEDAEMLLESPGQGRTPAAAQPQRLPWQEGPQQVFSIEGVEGKRVEFEELEAVVIAHEMGLICVSLSVSLLPNVIVSLMAAQAMHSQAVSIC